MQLSYFDVVGRMFVCGTRVESPRVILCSATADFLGGKAGTQRTAGNYVCFLQAYSYGGTTGAGHDADKVEKMSKVHDRVISVRFNADTAASMRWNFRPQQAEIKVV